MPKLLINVIKLVADWPLSPTYITRSSLIKISKSYKQMTMLYEQQTMKNEYV